MTNQKQRRLIKEVIIITSFIMINFIKPGNFIYSAGGAAGRNTAISALFCFNAGVVNVEYRISRAVGRAEKL